VNQEDRSDNQSGLLDFDGLCTLRLRDHLIDTGFQGLDQFIFQNTAIRILDNRPFIQELLF
jgi:hypothetical protein